MQAKLLKESSKYFTGGIEQRLKDIVGRPQMSQFYSMLFLHLANKDTFLEHLDNLKKSDKFKPDQLIDGLWSLSLCLKTLDPSNNFLRLYHQTLAELPAKGLVDRGLLIEYLPDQTLADSKIVEPETHRKRVTRQFTKLSYLQHKYNLLKQNNEGYGKVLVLLLALKDKDDPDQVYHSLVSLVGHFDLDPDRVLDLVLETYIQNPQAFNVYTNLLTKFERTSIPPLLADKFGKHALTEAQSQKLSSFESVQWFLAELNKGKSSQLNIPQYNLVTISAHLIKKGLIKLEEVIPHLLPSDKFLEADAEKRLALGQAKFAETFVISTEQLTDKQKKQQQEKERAEFFGQYLHNTKLWLLNQFVLTNNWFHFRQLWYLYGAYIDLITHQPLLNNLFKLIKWVIHPLYQRVSVAQLLGQKCTSPESTVFQTQADPSKEITQFKQVDRQMFDRLDELLGIVKEYVGFDSVLYVKLCRLFLATLNQDLRLSIDAKTLKTARSRILKIVKLYLLPGLNCPRCCSILEIELFPVLQAYGLKQRYQCYEYNYCGAMLNNPYFCREFAKVKKQQNVIFNTLSKENKKQYLKRVGKLSANHSFYVFYWVTSRMLLGDYESMVPDIVNVLANCNRLSLQVFVFVVLYNMAQQKQPSADLKTGQVAVWFRNCYTFLSLFYKKYYDTELGPVFQFILNRLDRPVRNIEQAGDLQTVELKFFKELISKMYGFKFVEDFNKNQLASMAAGPRLMFEAYDLTSDIRAAKKSASELEAFFWSKTLIYHTGANGNKYSLAFFLMVLLAQKRTQTLSKSWLFDLKILAQVYDQYTSSLTQFLKILSFMSENPEHYSKLLPPAANNPFQELVLDFKIPIELAFAIVRPSYRNINSMSQEEWINTTTNISSTIEKYLAAERSTMLIEGSEAASKLGPNLTAYKDTFKKVMNYDIYCGFWLLTLDGIYFPKKSYDDRIDQLKKKVTSWKSTERGGALMDKELEKIKTLCEKLSKEADLQRRKYDELLLSTNKARFKLEPKIQLSNDKKDKQVERAIDQKLAMFAEVLTQTCLLPRLLLEPSEALYCAKFVVLVAQCNQLTSIRSVRLILSIVEYAISYLGSATIKQSQCLTVFVSQLLNIFANWNDSNRLKDDFITKLGTDQALIKDNYTKMKQFLLKIFEKIANYIKLNKDEPYTIKNSLYLLDKLEVIPAFKQQAEDLQQYVRDLKDAYAKHKDMESLLIRHISILDAKKKVLPDRPDPNRKGATTPAPVPAPIPIVVQPEQRKPTVISQPPKLRVNSTAKSIPPIYRMTGSNSGSNPPTPTPLLSSQSKTDTRKDQVPSKESKSSFQSQQVQRRQKEELEKGQIPDAVVETPSTPAPPTPTAWIHGRLTTSKPSKQDQQSSRSPKVENFIVKQDEEDRRSQGEIQVRIQKSSGPSSAATVQIADENEKLKKRLLEKMSRNRHATNDPPKQDKPPATNPIPQQPNGNKIAQQTSESQSKPQQKEDVLASRKESRKDQGRNARQDHRREDEPKDNKKDQDRRDDTLTRKDTRREEGRKDQNRKEDRREDKRDQTRKQDRREETRKDQSRREETKGAQGRRQQSRKDERRQQSRKEDRRQESRRQEQRRQQRRAEQKNRRPDQSRKNDQRRQDKDKRQRQDRREDKDKRQDKRQEKDRREDKEKRQDKDKKQDRREDKDKRQPDRRNEEKRDDKDKREPPSGNRPREDYRKDERREDRREDRTKVTGDMMVVENRGRDEAKDSTTNGGGTSKDDRGRHYYGGRGDQERRPAESRNDSRRSRSREGKHRR